MKGKEALEILKVLEIVTYDFFQSDGKKAFFELGKLHERLSNIVEIDMMSLYPTISKEDLNE